MAINYEGFKFPKDKKQTKSEDKKVYAKVVKEQEECLLKDDKCFGKMELHHVLYKSQGGKATDKNMAKLCLYHHQIVHGNKKKYQEILLKKLKGISK